MIDDPSQATRWLEQISRDNIKHLVKLRIFVCAVYHLGPYLDLCGRPPSGPKWCELFDKLACEAVGLRDMYMYWYAEPTFWHFGGVFDLDVVRALARIKGLQKLEIDGFFAKESAEPCRHVSLCPSSGLSAWKYLRKRSSCWDLHTHPTR